ncbi:hypothetical protein E2C01_021257 [Portunus trituberculatus]|uniref:Uncharacterized protein n=1 Tax=Portunus trituberculatus TaxID=210409 RepID=A0A5B7E462_PORTR|nr:hypothetical protein [Portunus trituberculatus]
MDRQTCIGATLLVRPDGRRHGGTLCVIQGVVNDRPVPQLHLDHRIHSLPWHVHLLTPSLPLLTQWSGGRCSSGSAAPRSPPGLCSIPCRDPPAVKGSVRDVSLDVVLKWSEAILSQPSLSTSPVLNTAAWFCIVFCMLRRISAVETLPLANLSLSMLATDASPASC